jgi:6-phosphogluconolactonase
MATGNEELVVIGGYAAPDEPGVRVATFDTGTGSIQVVSEISGIENPSYLVAHPRYPWIYAVSEVDDEGAVVAIGLDRAPPVMALGGGQPSGGGLPCHLELAPSGRYLIVSNYGTGSVEVVTVEDDGSLGAVTDRQQHEGRGARPDRQEGPHAHASTFTPDGTHVLVNDLGTDQVVVYRFDHDRGVLQRERAVEVAPGAGPRHLVFHPAGHLLYVVNELASTVTTYGYNGDGMVTEAVADVSTRPAGIEAGTPENTPAAIAYVAANQRVYASNRGDDTIAAFDVDDDGTLRLAGIASSGGHWPRDFAIDPSGRWMLVAHQFGGTVTALGLSGSAAVGPSVAEIAVPGASCVRFLRSTPSG